MTLDSSKGVFTTNTASSVNVTKGYSQKSDQNSMPKKVYKIKFVYYFALLYPLPY